MPSFVMPLVRPLWPDTMSWDELANDLDQRLQLPGQTNAWTMPIRNRIDMLTTGIRTPVGIKVFGADLNQIQAIGQQLEQIIQKIPATRSVYGERVSGGYIVDFDLNRPEIARYGLTIDDVQNVIMTAIGGENVSTTIAGRERYPINVRYPRELRDEVDKLARVLVPLNQQAGMAPSGGMGTSAAQPAAPSGGMAQIPLGQLASIRLVEGPAMIRDKTAN